MLKLSLRDLRAHVGRYVLTFVAVAIGVAFMGGVLTLTDTITRTFDDLFADANEGTDAVVRGEAQFSVGAELGGGEMRPRIDASLLDQVSAVPGVATAEPSVFGYSRVIGKDGEPYGNPDFGPPTFGSSWVENEQLNPFKLTEGSRAPEGPDEIVLDKGTADGADYELGDTVGFQSPQGGGEATLVGIARFGTADSPFGASFVLFDLATAEELLAEPGKVDNIAIVAEEGTSQTEVRNRVADALAGDEVDVITGEALVQEDQDEADQQFSFFRIFLLVFAVIAVVVGAFVIYTSFSFIVAQRQRQVALLRAVGASRGQVLWSIVLESLVVGLLASMVGYVLGIGLAALLGGFFGDTAPLTIRPVSVAVAVVIGIAVTMASAIYPAWRGARIPPVAAMLDVAVDTTHRSRPRVVLSGVALIVGIFSLVQGLTGGSVPLGVVTFTGITASGIGIGLIFLALVIFGPIAARPAATVMGTPVAGVRGIIGRLAQQNASRNPRRTSATASALMIGLGLVTLAFVTDASIRRSIDQIVDDRFRGDFVVDSGTGWLGAGLPDTAAQEINQLEEVDTAAGIRLGFAEIDGSADAVSGLDPERAFDLFDVGVTEGNVRDLDEDGIAVFKEKAEDENWQVGDPVEVVFGETGTQEFTIAALLETKDLAGNYVMGTEAFDANFPNTGDNQILLRLADGVTPGEAEIALEDIVTQFPTAELQDLAEYKDATKAQFDPLLIMITVLLALTIVIAMVGIVNTLILSVVERTREIGLARAVGATRGQIRSAIRWEALLIAAFGLIAALGVGIFFGWVLVQALEDEGFSAFEIPYRSLVIVTLVTGMLTLAAAVIPAAWAGRRPMLTAIATE
jgi:putative ABC transport system permease protein